MGERGPPPKPTALRILEGNPANRPLPKNEPQLERAARALKPPKHLSKVAKAEWKRLYAPLHAQGLVTVGDLSAFEMYCCAYARWVEAEEQLAATSRLLKTPNGHVQANPWIAIARQQAELCKSFMIEFGMTPAARARMGAVLPDAPTSTNQEPQVQAGRFTGLVGQTRPA